MSSPALVLDASATLTWAFSDENNAYGNLILDSIVEEAEACVPTIWWLEVSNALLVAERRGRLSQVDIAQFLSFLWQLPIKVEVRQTEELPAETLAILALARTHQLSVYDAAYLNLAIYYGCPLATIDKNLRQAAANAGVRLFGK